MLLRTKPQLGETGASQMEDSQDAALVDMINRADPEQTLDVQERAFGKLGSDAARRCLEPLISCYNLLRVIIAIAARRTCKAVR